MEGGLLCGGRAVDDGAVGEAEGRAVPGAGDARLSFDGDDPALVERAAQVGAVVREHTHGLALAQGQQAQVAQLPPDRAAVRQVRQGAQVVPA